MRFVWLSLLSVMLCSGCKDPRRAALNTLKTQGASRLREDAQLLAAKANGTAFEITSEMLPASFVSFHPVAVRYYAPGYGILVTKWVSKESGVYVVPPASTFQPKDTSNVRYEKISDGIYWYDISG